MGLKVLLSGLAVVIATQQFGWDTVLAHIGAGAMLVGAILMWLDK